MLRKKILPILALGLLFVVGQVLVRGDESVRVEESSDATEPNLVPASDILKIKGLDLTSTNDDGRGKLIKQFGYAIFLVMILGVGAFYFTRKLIPRLSMSRGKNISVIETVSLGPNKMLHLVEVGDNRKLLIGSTSQSINLLAHVDDPVSDFPSVCEEDQT